MEAVKIAYFQGYSPESDGHMTNPDGTPMYDGTAYYLLGDSIGAQYADAYYCQAEGYKLSDAPSPKADALAHGGMASAQQFSV
jgi:hypothetical protein